MKKHLLFSAAWLCALATSHAAVTYSNFNDTTGLSLNGDAVTSSGVLVLTEATTNSAGSAFTTGTQPLGSSNSFSTHFQFRIQSSGGIADTDGAGADGIVFVIQTASNNVGGIGLGIGYAGIPASLGIEFDTYYNAELADPNGNHVGINLNGISTSIATTIEPVRFNNGSIWNAWIDYQGSTDVLEVRWSQSDVRPTSAMVSATVDLETVIGQDNGYIGFTSATGGAYGSHEILSWEFRSDYAPIPETSTAALLGVGALISLRRRR